jgi:NTE family protein
MSDDPVSAAAARPRIALALGSGGAKGLAHIGAIEALEAAGFAIVAIAGSSMGALVGGIYGAGRLGVYRDWVTSLAKMDVLRLVDWTLSGPGLIKGERIIGALRELVGEVDIEQLAIPFTAVATDIERQREVWISSGPLFEAIRASIAIPTLFHPQILHGRRLVDGGLLNPVPVTPLLRERFDYLVVVSLDGPAEAAPALPEAPPRGPYRQKIAALVEQLLGRGAEPVAPREPGWMELMGQALDLMQANLAHLRLAAYRSDLMIEVPRNACATYEFYRAGEMITLGRERTERALAAWRAEPPAPP